eukprot:3582729-Amphidinium_carterae.2
MEWRKPARLGVLQLRCCGASYNSTICSSPFGVEGRHDMCHVMWGAVTKLASPRMQPHGLSPEHWDSV